jgi:hypothetical protein
MSRMLIKVSRLDHIESRAIRNFKEVGTSCNDKNA